MRLHLALVLALVPSLAWAEDYAEAARKERERREKAKAAKSGQAYTQDDLANAGGGKGTVNIMTGPAPSSASSSTTGSSLRSGGGTAAAAAAPGGGPSIRTTSGDRGESYWRSRAASLRQAVASAQVRVTAAEQNMGRYVYGPPPGGCGSAEIDYRTGGIEGLKKAAKTPCKDPAAEWAEQRSRAASELDAAKAALASAQKSLDGLEEEARRAGAQPGWIR